MLKRYLIFSYLKWEAVGGWNDFVDSFDSIEEAINAPLSIYSEHGHIIDTQSEQDDPTVYILESGKWEAYEHNKAP